MSGPAPWPAIPLAAVPLGSNAPPSPDLMTRLANTLSALLEKLIDLYRGGWRMRWLTNALIGLGITFIAVRAIHRRFFARYRTDTSATTLLPEYDYIVVGAGSSGSALAARLSEDPSVTVLLLEAGGSDEKLNIDVPAAAIKLQRSESDWCYRTTPQAAAHGNMVDRVGHWPRGKVLGGSSSLNYMLMVRGAAADYDSWAAQGCEGWSYADVLPYFLRLESIRAPIAPSTARGSTGPLPCAQIISPQPTTLAFISATNSSGVAQRVEDYNSTPSGALAGVVGMSQYNVSPSGKRINTAAAYVAPALKDGRTNLHLLTHAHVQRVLFNSARAAQGVALRRGTDAKAMESQPDTFVRARREVILCAGTVGSPQLLELSGVGQRAVLDAAGVKVVHELPGVGENLQDHLALPVFHQSLIPTLSGADETLSNVAQWVLKGNGPLTGNMVESMSWVRSPASAGVNVAEGQAGLVPDIQFHYLAGTISPDDMHVFNTTDKGKDALRKLLAGGMQWTNAIIPTLLHPQSVGHVHISSGSALVPPVIEPNYLTRAEDVASLVAGCMLAMKIYEEPILKKITGKFLCDDLATGNPHNRATHPELYWEYYARQQSNTLYHPVGTCKMGAVTDRSAVVGPDLRVIGVSNLRVVDASVMPTLPSGNTNIPSVMIAEKAADLIQAARREAKQAKPAPKQQNLNARL